jgi:type II secretory pathway component PulL
MKKAGVWRRIAGWAAAMATAGCASVAPNSDRVVLTREASAVVGCKDVGSVEAWISLSFGDARVQLRNRAAALGADTILVNSSFGETTGTAYVCGSKK